MIARKFSRLVKKRWDTWDRGTDVIIPLQNKDLPVPPKCPTFLQPENGGTESWDIRTLEKSSAYRECPTVPHVPREKYNAWKNETEKNNSHTPDEQEAFEEAAANRLAMPVIAGVVDQFRQAFGSDQVRVVYAEEKGRKLGTPQPSGVKPVITGAGAPKRTTRKEVRS